LRQRLTERYRERLAGYSPATTGLVITGTLPGACYAGGMNAVLSARRSRSLIIRDLPNRFVIGCANAPPSWPVPLALHRAHRQEPNPQGGRRRQGAAVRGPIRPGAYHLGDGSLQRLQALHDKQTIAPSAARYRQCLHYYFYFMTPSWA